MAQNKVELCRELRKNQTDTEKRLWRILRSRQFNGVKFRRQYSIGNYILDFYSPKHRICIELDGGQHFEERHIHNDEVRTKSLENLGIKILRFSNKEVFNNMMGICITIEKEIAPHPALSPDKGRGEK